MSVAKLEAFGWDEGTRLVADAVARGLRVATSSGSDRSTSPTRRGGTQQRERLVRSIETAAAVGAECIVFTTGPFAPLTWEEAADALEAALAPVLVEARGARRRRSRSSTRTRCASTSGFVHTLRDAIDLARRLDTGVCMELNACWAERALATTIRDGVDRIRLVQVSDFKVGTVASSQRLVPGDGDIPIARILARRARRGLRRACSTSS